MPRRAVPRELAGLDEVGKASYLAAKAALEKRGVDPIDFGDALRRYALAAQDAAGFRRAWQAEEHPWMSLGGTTGRVEVEHPLVKTIRDADTQAAKFGAALGLDPESLVKLTSGRSNPGAGRPSGSASAPDRKFVPPARVTRLEAVPDEAKAK